MAVDEDEIKIKRDSNGRITGIAVGGEIGCLIIIVILLIGIFAC